MVAAAEGHGRTTTGRCEPSHPAKRRHLILLKSRGELLRCWKFGNDQITNFYLADTLSVGKASSLLAGAHGVLSDPPQKEIVLFL